MLCRATGFSHLTEMVSPGQLLNLNPAHPCPTSTPHPGYLVMRESHLTLSLVIWYLYDIDLMVTHLSISPPSPHS